MLYLDNTATSFPKPESVYKAMDEFMRHSAANPGRSGHKMSITAEQMVTETRNLLAKFFNARHVSNLVFTLNTTDALNIAIKGVISAGDHVITSCLEHNSVSRPLQRLKRDGLISVDFIKASTDGFIDPADVKNAIKSNTRLIVLTHCSNVLGTVQPIREFGKIARDRGVLFLVDAAQTAGVLPIDVEEDCVDMLAFPGHKALFGPPGTGGLWTKQGLSVRYFREGGTGKDSQSEIHPVEMPYRLEAGTPNTAGIAGLNAGVKFILSEGMRKIHGHELVLTKKLLDFFAANKDKFTLYGPTDCANRLSTISFNVKNMPPEEVSAVLDNSFDTASRSGLHCAPLVHKHIGTFPDGTVRFGIGYFNTPEDVDNVMRALEEIASV